MYIKIVDRESETLVSCDRVTVAQDVKAQTTWFNAELIDGRSCISIAFPRADRSAVYLMNDAGATIESWYADRRDSHLDRIEREALGPPDRPPYSPAKNNPLIDPMAAVERHKAKETVADKDDLDTRPASR